MLGDSCSFQWGRSRTVVLPAAPILHALWPWPLAVPLELLLAEVLLQLVCSIIASRPSSQPWRSSGFREGEPEQSLEPGRSWR